MFFAVSRCGFSSLPPGRHVTNTKYRVLQTPSCNAQLPYIESRRTMEQIAVRDKAVVETVELGPTSTARALDIVSRLVRVRGRRVTPVRRRHHQNNTPFPCIEMRKDRSLSPFITTCRSERAVSHHPAVNAMTCSLSDVLEKLDHSVEILLLSQRGARNRLSLRQTPRKLKFLVGRVLLA